MKCVRTGKATRLAISSLLALSCALVAWPAMAQSAVQTVGGSNVVPGERLSDWLLRNAAPDADLTALHWRVEAERAAQERLRAAVVQGLPAQGAVAQWVQSLPVTGRLPLAHHDARWMQAAIQHDPVLANGQSVRLLARPSQIAVVGSDGLLCQVAHRPGAHARDYVSACAPSAMHSLSPESVDRVWVAQPDGRVADFGVQAWNEQAEDEIAPGAWVWAPNRNAKVSAATSSNLIRFLATQLPAEVLFAEGKGKGGLTVRTLEAGAKAPVSAPGRNLALTASDWGEIGLLQTPTARMEAAGEIRSSISAVWPYVRWNVMLQPLDWFEVGFRYTDVQTALYGPSIAGDQTYKDKSIDVKLRLLEESAWTPQVALGMRDLGGTGLFSGEYLVANKRWGAWDASLGLGWGYMGARGNVKAPLGFLGDAYKTRGVAEVGQGGTINSGGMFRGDAALFGGVQWQTPVDGLILKAELDGNDYGTEPFDSNVDAKSPLNWGAAYRYSPYVDFSAGWERGNRLAFGVTLHEALDKLDAPKVLDPKLPAVQALPPASTLQPLSIHAPEIAPEGWAKVSDGLSIATGWRVNSLDLYGSVLTVRAETDQAVFMSERVERAITVLHSLMPPSTRRFVLQLSDYGVGMSSHTVDRAEWVAQRTQAQAPSLKLPAIEMLPAPALAGSAAEAPALKRPLDTSLHSEWGPSYSQILGGPDGFLLYEVGLQAKFEKRFGPSTWLSGGANLRLLDNYAGFKYDAPSNLPRVRTYAREYVTTSRLTLPNLQMTHVEDLGGGHYASVYGGMLEDMYGGVGGEWLYRPWKSRVAFGVDVNHVRQRAFAQNLSFRDYAVNTGHASLYWDSGWNDVQVKLSAGQYLAGDTGATVDVKRVFRNGTAIGAWATKTNVSAEQFGEGSFDKGIYITMPLDVVLPKSAPGAVNVLWNPLTRDGGARLSRSVSLFDFTRQRDGRTWKQSSKAYANSRQIVSGADTTYVEPEPSGGLWGYAADSATGVTQGIANVPGSAWAWGGAFVLGASLLDNEVDQWARDHQGENWDRAGKLASNIPVAMALGTGLLFTGIAGEDAAVTARTSLTAAAYTLGGNFVTKWAVGRARPADELGSGSFNSFGPGATQSSFGSNHVALAFALATPFARQYDNPWLYALAGTTAIGRIQNREHWLSDTVAGGLLGYAIGTITYESQQGGKRNLRLSTTGQAVNATWSY